MTITRNELAEVLSRRMGINKGEAKEVVGLFFEILIQALEKNQSIKLAGFAGFYLRDKSKRVGRNPKTGEEQVIAARRVVLFKASEKLKQKVMQYGNTESEIGID